MANDYALVAYLGGELSEFAGNLRAELTPNHAQLRPHVTILPPRQLTLSEQATTDCLRNGCRQFAALRIGFEGIENFLPANAAIYLGVRDGARHLRSMHDQLNSGELFFAEPWPYVPHLTLAHFEQAERVVAAVEIAKQRWRDYRGAREFLVEELTFVREQREDCWEDLATIPLGG
jgi:2'-5' RNA ligase